MSDYGYPSGYGYNGYGYQNNGYNNGYSTGYTNRNYYSYGEPGYSSNFLQTWGFFFAVIGALLIAAIIIGWFVYRMFYKDRAKRNRYAYDAESLDRKPEYQLRRTEPELKRTRSQLRRTESQRKKEYQLKRTDSQRTQPGVQGTRGGSPQNITESQQKLVGSQQTLSSDNQPKLGSQQTLTSSQPKLAGSIPTLPEVQQQQSLTHEKLRQFQAKPPVIVQRARTTEPLQKSNYTIQTEVEQHNGRYASSTGSTPSPGASPSPGATPPTGRYDQRKDRVGIFAGRTTPTTTDLPKPVNTVQNSIFSGMTFADSYQKKATYPSSVSPGGTPRAGITNMSPGSTRSGIINGLPSGTNTSSSVYGKSRASPTPSTPTYGRNGRSPTPTTPTHEKATISSGIVLSPAQVSDARPHFPESPAPIARSKRQEFFEEINDTTGYESKLMTKTFSCEFRSSAKHSDV